MMDVPNGAKCRSILRVGPEHLANQMKDPMLPPVLATPVMILAMENAALNAVRRYLDAGETALGTRVDVRHFSATVSGQCVTATAEVTDVDGRRLIFEASAHNGIEEIGRGAHERVVIDLFRFKQRLAAKKTPPVRCER